MFEWIIGALLVILIPAVIFDLRYRRIPNVVSLAGWVIGPLMYALVDSLPGILSSVYGFLLLLLFMLPFYVVNWMGAGDVKLMAGVGAIVGIEHGVAVLLGIVITGAVMGIMMLLHQRLLSESFQRYKNMLGITLAMKKPVYLAPGEQEQKVIIPYAIPIALGTFISIWLMYVR